MTGGPPPGRSEQAQQSIDQLLTEAPQAQEVWGVTLEVLDGLVVQTMRAGWPPHLARQLVAWRFMNGGM